MHYQPNDRPTNRPTDTASYRGALPHLKRGQTLKQTEPETDTEIWTVTKGNADRDRVRSSHPIKLQFGSGCQNKVFRCNNCLVSNFHINFYDCQSQMLLFPFWAADERIYIIESIRVVVRVSVHWSVDPDEKCENADTVVDCACVTVRGLYTPAHLSATIL